MRLAQSQNPSRCCAKTRSPCLLHLYLLLPCSMTHFSDSLISMTRLPHLAYPVWELLVTSSAATSTSTQPTTYSISDYPCHSRYRQCICPINTSNLLCSHHMPFFGSLHEFAIANGRLICLWAKFRERKNLIVQSLDTFWILPRSLYTLFLRLSIFACDINECLFVMSEL